MELIGQILEWIKEVITDLLPFVVIREYELGIVLRFGRYKKSLGPGFYWKWPFIDEVSYERSSVTTFNIKPQSLTTKDGQTIVISAVIKYKIEDIRIFLIDVENAVDAIGDLTQGKIKTIVMARTWAECCSDDLDKEIKQRIESEARKWGLKIQAATVTDLALMRSFRIIR